MPSSQAVALPRGVLIITLIFALEKGIFLMILLLMRCFKSFESKLWLTLCESKNALTFNKIIVKWEKLSISNFFNLFMMNLILPMLCFVLDYCIWCVIDTWTRCSSTDHTLDYELSQCCLVGWLGFDTGVYNWWCSCCTRDISESGTWILLRFQTF